jgi:TPR repeat protein
VLPPAFPAPTSEARSLFEEGWNLYIAGDWKHAANFFEKAVLLKHPTAHALLSEMYLFGRTGLAKQQEKGIKFAEDGAAMGCKHCLGLLGMIICNKAGEDPENGLVLALESARAGSCFGMYSIFCCYTSESWVDFKSRRSAIDEKTCIRYLKLAASQGYAEALSHLGQCYKIGFRGIITEDKDEAMALLRLAADQGHFRAQNQLGLMLASSGNKTEAARYFRMAADYDVAQVSLARMHDTGDGAALDKEEAMRLFTLAADQDNAEAEFALGMMLLQGCDGINAHDHDTKRKATRLIRSAANRGLAHAQYQYAVWLWDGKLPEGGGGTERDAFRYMTLAAHQGHIEAQCKMGEVSFMESGDTHYLRLAAEQGHIGCQRMMGSILELGLKGNTADFEDAATFYRLAAEQGDAEAQVDIARMLHEGKGVAQNYAEAFRFALLSVNQGHIYGLNLLAELYAKGHGVEQNEAEALRLFCLAAEQDSHSSSTQRAQTQLGFMYSAGKGVEKDHAQAERFFRLAMDQGNFEAHYGLGVMMFNGGVEPQDPTQKAQLFIRAAESGHPEAQLEAARTLLNGEKGVAVDKDEAARFCRLAIAQGHTPAKTFLGRLLASEDYALRNQEEAVALFRDASKDDPEAAVSLGVMLYRGEGVAADLEEAVLMFVMASEKGLQEQVCVAFFRRLF